MALGGSEPVEEELWVGLEPYDRHLYSSKKENRPSRRHPPSDDDKGG
jgi:hypothetical protein